MNSDFWLSQYYPRICIWDVGGIVHAGQSTPRLLERRRKAPSMSKCPEVGKIWSFISWMGTVGPETIPGLNYWETTSQAGTGGSLEAQRRAQQQVCGRQSREISTQKSALTNVSQPEMVDCTAAHHGEGGWVLRHGVQGSDPRERTGIDCREDTQRGLIRHSWGKSLGLPEGRQVIASTSACSQMLGHMSVLRECLRWDWLQLLSATPEGFWLAASKANVSARGRTSHGSGLQPQRWTRRPATGKVGMSARGRTSHGSGLQSQRQAHRPAAVKASGSATGRGWVAPQAQPQGSQVQEAASRHKS